jgi:hypothetical protein
MAKRKTKEERAQEKSALEAQRAVEHAEYVAGLPMRVLMLQVESVELGVGTQVKSHNGYPVVGFYHESFDWTYIVTGPEASEPWELENLEADFRAIRSMREQEKRKRELAKAVRDKLTPDELDALFRYPKG